MHSINGDTMKKILLILMCCVLTFVTVFKICYRVDDTISDVIKNVNISPTVVIDAGHGGLDAGTVGIDGSLEKGINLSIALNLYDFLTVSGIKCELTRSGDNEVYKDGEDRSRSDLYNRMDYINSFENPVLISIHQNHFENESEHGTQIWYSSNNDESKIIADKILNSIKDNLQPDNDRENKESGSDYYLLFKAKAPSVMVECGFVSNREENSKLQDISYQKKMAYSILYGLSEEV